MGVELAAIILVLTGVEALEMPISGWMRVFCLLLLMLLMGLRFIYILTY
jgi:hypothetical protein